MPMAAALSANHLAVFRLPRMLRRLYVAHDNDAAGRRAAHELRSRAQTAGIKAITLTPSLKDFNDDLRQLGVDALRATLRDQLSWRTSAGSWRRRAERPDEHAGRGTRSR